MFAIAGRLHRFGHLFIADLLSSLLLAEFEDCASASAIATTTSSTASGLTVHTRDPEDMQMSRLPPLAPHHIHANSICSKEFPPFMRLNAQAVHEGAELGSCGSQDHNEQCGKVSSSPPGAWNLIEERPGKAGWVHEFDPTAPSGEGSSASANATLVFSPDEDQTKLLQENPRLEYFISIHYFRTYSNAGLVEVSWCNQTMGTLDALWGDPTYHISINEVSAMQIGPLRCGEHPTNFDLTFTHVHLSDMSTRRNLRERTGSVPVVGNRSNRDEGRGLLSDSLQSRGNQKFKVVGVMICREAQE